MKYIVRPVLLLMFSLLVIGRLPAIAQEPVFPVVPPAAPPILENNFRLDNSSGLWVRPLTVSGSFSNNLVDPSFALKHYKEVGIDENRRLKLIDLVANASAEMTRAEHLSAGVNDTLNEQLAQTPIDASAVMSSFDAVLDRENTLKRIRFELMIEATSMLSQSEIEALQELRNSRTRIVFDRLSATLDDE